MLDSHEGDYLLSEEETKPGFEVSNRPHSCHPSTGWRMTIAVLFVSLILNAMSFFVLTKSREPAKLSDFAHLSQTVSEAWLPKSPFFGEGTEEDADRVWDQLDTDIGIVALNHSYAEEMDLPQAQNFPWDHSKGIYLLNGYHAMHCVKNIRTWVRQVDQGLPTTRSTEHVLHCLNALRQDIECYADDTPLYTGNQERGLSGTGQVRRCRSWSQLETWAKHHTACYQYRPELHDKHDNTPSLEEFTACPDGSPYVEKIEAWKSKLNE